MRVLVACEFSGTVRDAFRKRGHDAWSCDLLPSESDEKWHLDGDALAWIAEPPMGEPFDLMIAHPPCTYLANSGVQHLVRDADRKTKMLAAVEFFMSLLNAPIPRVAVENPVPHSYANLPKYHQIVQPWMHGDEATKKTCLWLKNLPPLVPSKVVSMGAGYVGKDGRRNGSEWYQLAPAKDRWKIRSRTFQGIADAMADQWGKLSS